MSSLCLYLSTFRRVFPFLLLGLAMVGLIISIVADVSIVRSSPLVHLDNGLSLIMPTLLTFFEAVLPLIFAFLLYRRISAYRSNTPRSELSEVIKTTFVKGFAAGWLCVIVLLAAVSLLLDIYFAFSVAPLVTSICGLVWICIGFWLMTPIRLAPRLILLALSLFLILAVKHIDWNSRRPFVRDLLKIESGMTANEVDRIMKRYRRGSSSENDALFYMHGVKGPFYSDMGVVKLKNDKVEAVELQFD
jgi:uncharacterized membrane protein